MKKLLAFIFVVALVPAQAQKVNKKLQQSLETLTTGFKGDVGIYVKDLHTGKIASIHADSIFPTASMVKVPILIGIMDKLNKGELKYHQELTYKDSLLYAGSDLLASLKHNEKVELSKVIMLMLTTSDNTASLWLQSLAGTGTRINQILDSIGYTATRVNSRTPGREAGRDKFGWGQTSPKEMATMFEALANRNLMDATSSEKMLRLLGRNYWDEEALSQIPPDVFVASKNGAVNASRSEVVYVSGKNARYVF
ncbi:MAG: class A beta-lactamase-related serine hydrolase, partial [Bacteroidetes bacterium]|nr:class A beta-lactamase-related serine hydrolase [Bacteroidota bacterium]